MAKRSNPKGALLRASIKEKVNEYINLITPTFERELERYRKTTGYQISKYTYYDIQNDMRNEMYYRLASKGQPLSRNIARLESWIDKFDPNKPIGTQMVARIAGRNNLARQIFDGQLDDKYFKDWSKDIWVQGRIQTAGGGAFLIANAFIPYKEFYYTTKGNEAIHNYNNAVHQFGKTSAEARRKGRKLVDEENAYQRRIDEASRKRSEEHLARLARGEYGDPA